MEYLELPMMMMVYELEFLVIETTTKEKHIVDMILYFTFSPSHVE